MHRIMGTAAALALWAAGTVWAGEGLFQVATLQGLMKGLYDGDMTFANLAREGDLGLGTFNRLDGEMIALDGRFYRMRPDRHASPVPPEEHTPFALITRWDPEQSYPLPPSLDRTGLEEWLKQRMEGPNRFHAFRADGRFWSMKVRSVPAQNPPYPLLTEVVKQQTVWSYDNVDGTLVGFWVPDYAAGLNAAGFHFHFITADRQSGGHVMDLVTQGGVIGIDRIDRLVVQLPAGEAFSGSDLAVSHGDVMGVERPR